jgi:hypothetical protein
MIDKILSFLKVSRLKWHDLRSVEPASRKFGFDRGVPIDRYYIEKFLNDHRQFIRGTTLEIADSLYTRKFGQDITAYEVLHVEKTAKATIVGDLSDAKTLPSNAIDCFVCTQTLNFIYDFKLAIRGAHQVLKPGGTFLATVGSISQISRYDADRWGHFWSFYPQGVKKAFDEIFGEGNVSVKMYGNSLSATSFLRGLASDELTKEELDFYDQDYPVTIGLVAIKR